MSNQFFHSQSVNRVATFSKLYMSVSWAKTGPKPLGDACFTPTFELWNAGSDRIAKIRTANFEFKGSATIGLLLTN